MPDRVSNVLLSAETGDEPGVDVESGILHLCLYRRCCVSSSGRERRGVRGPDDARSQKPVGGKRLVEDSVPEQIGCA